MVQYYSKTSFDKLKSLFAFIGGGDDYVINILRAYPYISVDGVSQTVFFNRGHEVSKLHLLEALANIN